MFLVSKVLNSFFLKRLQNKDYRKTVFIAALNKELRNKKTGRILLRNLNELMNANKEIHEEFKELLNGEDYQKDFWESDLGYMWFEGNTNDKKSYFDVAIQLINEEKMETILDVGCGWGVFCNRCVKETNAKKVKGIDIGEGVINNAKDRFSDERLTFEVKNLFDEDNNYDLVSVFGSIDYVHPSEINLFVKKMIDTANKKVVIVNSLRKTPIEEYKVSTLSKAITRYDVGYVHPIPQILEEMKKNMTFSFDVVKSGLDSALIIISK
ncbi:MAG: class I SAM-dependent methyltransferase [Bacteroidota bacterium]|nr:class I SAM-dependent methyltransferase [Bacteroidota bacterium]